MIKSILTILIAINLLQPSTSQACSFVDDLTLTLLTQNGPIRGKCETISVSYATATTTSADVLVWQAIPYAEPPVGKNRFRPPVPLKGTWNGILDGRNAPKACLQRQPGLFGLDINGQSSEDCLYLNIYAERNAYINRREGAFKPVLVFIHGGGFVEGASSEYDGRTIASLAGVIVVTIQYRLNALGSLHMADTYATGNQGLLDAQLALKWISENARQFGGDSAKITISGESAGAWITGYQLYMRPSWPYFRNAILQSGGPTGKNNWYRLVTSEDATDRTKAFFSALNCTNSNNTLALACAEKKSESDFSNAYQTSSMNYQVIDNIVFKKSIPELTADKAFKNCSVLTGHNSDEYSLFILYLNNLTLGLPNSLGNIPSKESLANFSMNQFYDFLNQTYKVIPKPPYQPIQYSFSSIQFFSGKIFLEYFTKEEIANIDSVQLVTRLSQILSDHWFACQSYQLATVFSSAGNDAYVYHFDYKLSSSFIPESLSEYFGEASHADELAVVPNAQPLQTMNFNRFPQADRDLSQRLVFYWTNFAKYDDPSGVVNESVATWLPFANATMASQESIHENGRYMSMRKEKFSMERGFTEHHCKFWGF